MSHTENSIPVFHHQLEKALTPILTQLEVLEQRTKNQQRVIEAQDKTINTLVDLVKQLADASRMAGAANKLMFAAMVDRNIIPSQAVMRDVRESMRKTTNDETTDYLSKRSREASNQPATGDDSTGYLESRERVHTCELHSVVQRWIDQNPEWFQAAAGEYWPIPTGINPAIFTGLELALMRAAEELRRRRVSVGPESHSYPQLTTQRTNAQTQPYQGKS
jgi:hypothetical protein